MSERDVRLDETSLLDLESAIGEFEAGGWGGINRRRAIIAAAYAFLSASEIQWCETHKSVDVDGYCESFYDDAASGGWDRKHYDDVIARRFGVCHIVSARLTPLDSHP
jgi:hypothetical protein